MLHRKLFCKFLCDQIQQHGRGPARRHRRVTFPEFEQPKPTPNLWDSALIWWPKSSFGSGFFHLQKLVPNLWEGALKKVNLLGRGSGFGGFSAFKQKERADFGPCPKGTRTSRTALCFGVFGVPKSISKKTLFATLFGAKIHPKRSPPGSEFCGRKPVVPVQQQL